jgi:Acetyltransferase (GNAT) domain
VRFLPHVPHPLTRADAERFVAINILEDWQQSPTFAVALDGKLIGTVNLEVDRATRTAMLGYAIGRQWWGQGLATEAACAPWRGVLRFFISRVSGHPRTRGIQGRGGCWKSWECSMRQSVLPTTWDATAPRSTR